MTFCVYCSYNNNDNNNSNNNNSINNNNRTNRTIEQITTIIIIINENLVVNLKNFLVITTPKLTIWPTNWRQTKLEFDIRRD